MPIPPLRERREDIPLLAEHFLQLYAARNNRQADRGLLARRRSTRSSRYDWPGNVRELENTDRARGRAVARARAIERRRPAARGARRGGGVQGDGRVAVVRVGTPLEEVERRVIHETLRHSGGDKRLCAQLLGIATRTIYRRLEEERDRARSGRRRRLTPSARPRPSDAARPAGAKLAADRCGLEC